MSACKMEVFENIRGSWEARVTQMGEKAVISKYKDCDFLKLYNYLYLDRSQYNIQMYKVVL